MPAPFSASVPVEPLPASQLLPQASPVPTTAQKPHPPFESNPEAKSESGQALASAPAPATVTPVPVPASKSEPVIEPTPSLAPVPADPSVAAKEKFANELNRLRTHLATCAGLWRSPLTLTAQELTLLLRSTGDTADFLLAHTSHLIASHRQFPIVTELVTWSSHAYREKMKGGDVIAHAGNVLLLQPLRTLLDHPNCLILPAESARHTLYTTLALDELVTAAESVDQVLTHLATLHELHRSFTTCDELIAAVQQATDMGFFLPRPLLQRIIDYVKKKPHGVQPTTQLFAPLNGEVPEMDAELLDTLISNLGTSVDDRTRWLESLDSKVDVCIDYFKRFDAAGRHFDSWESLCEAMLVAQQEDMQERMKPKPVVQPTPTPPKTLPKAPSTAPSTSSSSAPATASTPLAPATVASPAKAAAAPTPVSEPVPQPVAVESTPHVAEPVPAAASGPPALMTPEQQQEILAILGDDSFLIFEDAEEDVAVSVQGLEQLVLAAGEHGPQGLIHILSGLDGIGRRAKSFDALISMVGEVVTDGAYSSRAARSAILDTLCDESECRLFAVGSSTSLTSHTISFLRNTPVAQLDALILALGGSSCVPTLLEYLVRLSDVGQRFDNFEDILTALTNIFHTDQGNGTGSFVSKKDMTELMNLLTPKKPHRHVRPFLPSSYNDQRTLLESIRDSRQEFDDLFILASETSQLLNAASVKPIGMFGSTGRMRTDSIEEDEDQPSDLHSTPETGLELIIQQLEQIQSANAPSTSTSQSQPVPIYDSFNQLLVAVTSKIASMKAAHLADEARRFEMFERLNRSA